MQNFRKISAFLFSILVLFSSTGFTLNMHFCMGEIENIAFFNEAKTCEMVTRPAKCVSEDHNHSCNPTQLTQEGCCEDQTLLIKGQDELAQAASVSMTDIQIVCVLYVVTSVLFKPASLNTDSYKEYSPPLIGRDIPVLVQTFLI